MSGWSAVMGPDAADRAFAFFGRRKGKPLRAGQAEAVDAVVPDLALDLNQPAPTDLKALFRTRVERVYLESGFGGGEHLVGVLGADAQLGMIGAEPFVNGVAKLALQITDPDLAARLRLHPADALPLLDWLPSASLDRFYLLYPDPWPKSRHWKRRFVQRDTLDRLARVLRPGAEFRFASDWAPYVRWTLQRVLAHPAFEWVPGADATIASPWEGWVRTRYEEKALNEGRTPAYCRFRRKP